MHSCTNQRLASFISHFLIYASRWKRFSSNSSVASKLFVIITNHLFPLLHSSLPLCPSFHLSIYFSIPRVTPPLHIIHQHPEPLYIFPSRKLVAEMCLLAIIGSCVVSTPFSLSSVYQLLLLRQHSSMCASLFTPFLFLLLLQQHLLKHNRHPENKGKAV